MTKVSVTSVGVAQLDSFAPLAKTVAGPRTGNGIEQPRFPDPAVAIMAHLRHAEWDGETSA